IARPIKLIGVSSADCIAAEAQAQGLLGKISVVIDAQRNEIYLAAWEITAQARTMSKPLRLASMAEVQLEAQQSDCVIGPEIESWFAKGRLIFPRASTLARLASETSDFVS